MLELVNDCRRFLGATSYRCVCSRCRKVIYYLQTGFAEPVLPSLQMLSKHLGEGQRTLIQDNRSYDVSMVSATTCLKNWQMPSRIPDLDSLVRGFFDFYVNRFDFATDVVSVRLGLQSSRAMVSLRDNGLESEVSTSKRVSGHRLERGIRVVYN